MRRARLRAPRELDSNLSNGTLSPLADFMLTQVFVVKEESRLNTKTHGYWCECIHIKFLLTFLS